VDSLPPSPGPAAPAEPPEPRFHGPSPRGALILAAVGVTTAAVLGALVSARLGALAVAATLVVGGTWRAVKPRTPFATGLAVRSKAIDVFLYFSTAAAIAFLALTVPHLG